MHGMAANNQTNFACLRKRFIKNLILLCKVPFHSLDQPLGTSLRLIHFHILLMIVPIPYSNLAIICQFYLEILSLFVVIFVIIFLRISS